MWEICRNIHHKPSWAHVGMGFAPPNTPITPPPKGDGGDGGKRILLEDPTPINPHRDNISRKDNPSLRYTYM